MSSLAPMVDARREPIAASPLVAANRWLRLGQAFEATGRMAEAIAAFDHSGACAREPSVADSAAGRWARALAAMNRGNVLQRQTDAAALGAAVRSYDVAVALFEELARGAGPAARNACGAAWLNRGRALQLRRDPASLAAAVAAHERAIEWLRELPADGPEHFARNLTGAWLNLADALLGLGAADARTARRAREAAGKAMALAAPREHQVFGLADLGLKARRAFVEATGQLLLAGGGEAGALDALAGEATDAVDDGLALARGWIGRGHDDVRALAVRLFRFGAQLYREHQPHFLAEFLLEQLADASLGKDAMWRAIADEALTVALHELRRPRLLQAGDPESERILGLARELEAAARQLAA